MSYFDRGQSTWLAFVDDALRSDKEVVLHAIRCHAFALKYAGDALRADKDVVMEAVRADASMLRFANDTLLVDREVVEAAERTTLVRNSDSERYASSTIKIEEDITIMLRKVSHEWR